MGKVIFSFYNNVIVADIAKIKVESLIPHPFFIGILFLISFIIVDEIFTGHAK